MADFSDYFDSFTDRAFRFETLPTYLVDEEARALAAFTHGWAVPEDWHDDWVDFVRQATAAGKSVVRVRVVPEPSTTYYNFEVAHGYARSVPAGETIYTIAQSDLPSSARGVGDYWLFDAIAVATLAYDHTGRFQNVTVETDHTEISRRQGITNELIDAATPITGLPPR